jgi:hypothetical protein
VNWIFQCCVHFFHRRCHFQLEPTYTKINNLTLKRVLYRKREAIRTYFEYKLMPPAVVIWPSANNSRRHEGEESK